MPVIVTILLLSANRHKLRIINQNSDNCKGLFCVTDCMMLIAIRSRRPWRWQLSFVNMKHRVAYWVIVVSHLWQISASLGPGTHFSSSSQQPAEGWEIVAFYLMVVAYHEYLVSKQLLALVVGCCWVIALRYAIRTLGHYVRIRCYAIRQTTFEIVKENCVWAYPNAALLTPATVCRLVSSS